MKEKSSINKELIKRIQPRGGMSFKDEMYVKSGDGYTGCLHIMEYPKEDYDHWLNRICNIPGTIATVDISTDDINEVKKNINKSMQEQKQRFQSSKKYTDEADAEERYLEMKKMADELRSMNDVVKNIDCRIFFSNRSLVKLEEESKEKRLELDTSGYKGYFNLNETKSDWTSFYRPYSYQQKNAFATDGQPLTSNDIAGGNPFHFCSLNDPLGAFYGSTSVGGNVLWDFFHKSARRSFYNALTIGQMGFGKSTILKKIMKDRIERGDFVRTFDVSGEFRQLGEEFGAKILNLDGSEGDRFNFLEILRAGDNEATNFSRHIAKVKTIYRFLSPDVNDDLLDELGILLRELYDRYELSPVDQNGQERIITGLPSHTYPILSDLVEQCRIKLNEMAQRDYNELELKIAEHNALIISTIERKLESVIQSYGSIFNGYSTFDNVVDEQVIIYDLTTLKEMEPTIFDAQFYNLLALSWDNAVANGTLMMNKNNKKEIDWQDIIRFLIIIDESHRVINANKIKALDQLTTYMREGRKYFAGFLLASQSMRDYVPEGCSDLAIDKLKTIFELTQYKLIFKQDENVLPHIEKIFGNILTEGQISEIPILEQGNCFMCISGDTSFKFKVYITPEEEQLFNGGA